MKRPATALPVLALALLAGCGGAPVGGPDAVDGPDFELRVRRDGANASARADTSSATLAQRMSIRTPFVYWDERPHPAMPANQHLVLISVVIEPNGPTWLNDIALQCDAAAVRQAWALVGGQRVRIYPIDMDGPGAYSYADELLQAHDGGSGTAVFAQTAEARDGDAATTDYTALTGTVVTWTFGSVGPAQGAPGYAVDGATRHDPNVGMAWGFLVPAGATEIGIGGELLGSGSKAANGPVTYANLMGTRYSHYCVRSAYFLSRTLPGPRAALRGAGDGDDHYYPPYTAGPIGGLSFSWDGTRVAYAQSDSYRLYSGRGPDKIRVNARPGTGYQAIYTGTSPSLCPDGSRLAFERDTASHTMGIWVTDAHAGAQPLVVYDDPVGQERWPAWHPNGSCIAFTSDKSGTQRLYTMAPDGTGVAPIGDLRGTGAGWSFDGRMLAYGRDGWAYVANADGTGERRLAAGDLPRWSPSGRSLLVLRAVKNWRVSVFDYHGYGSALYCVDVETGVEECIVGPAELPQESPDDPRIALLSVTTAAWRPVIE